MSIHLCVIHNVSTGRVSRSTGRDAGSCLFRYMNRNAVIICKFVRYLPQDIDERHAISWSKESNFLGWSHTHDKLQNRNQGQVRRYIHIGFSSVENIALTCPPPTKERRTCLLYPIYCVLYLPTCQAPRDRFIRGFLRGF